MSRCVTQLEAKWGDHLSNHLTLHRSSKGRSASVCISAMEQ